MRTRVLYLAAIGIGAVTSIACAWAALLEHTLVADPPVQYFGVLRQGAEVEARFRLTNRSFRVVEVEQVLPNCQCTDVDVSPKLLAPFAAATVRAKWRVGSHRGRTETDLLVNFKSSQASQAGSLTLRLQADVTPDVAVSPGRLVFSPTASSERTLVYTPLAGSSVEVRSVTTDFPAFQARLLGRENKIVVKFDPGRWPSDGPPPHPHVILRTTSRVEPDVAVELVVASDE